MSKAKKVASQKSAPKAPKAPEAPKGNLIQQMAKRKAEAQAAGQKKNPFGKDLGEKLSKRGDSFFVPTKPGGRNGQGKP